VTSAVEQIAYYFGTIGIGSIVAWLVAVVLIVLFVCGVRRSLICWSALAAAIAGLVLANINSNQISAIEIDFSAEIQAAEERAAADPAEETPRESDVSQQGEEAKRKEAVQGEEPAEDAGHTRETDEADKTRIPSDNHSPRDDQTASTHETSGYAYRRHGKVDRTEGMTLEDRIPIGSGTEDQPVIANIRVMKTHEVAHANRLDRLNLFFARLTLTLAVLLVAVDYVRRFNMTFKALFPLPVGGPLIDSFFPKTHTVCVGARRKRRWKRFLRRVVRKGETFIYIGDQDPCPARRLGRIPLLPKAVWPLDKITRPAGDREFDDDFLFESAWFGRYCFVILDHGHRAADLLAALADFLRLRHATRAAARHTVNVIWDLPAIPAEHTLERLAALCPETNFKLLVAAHRPLTETQETCFDETTP